MKFLSMLLILMAVTYFTHPMDITFQMVIDNAYKKAFLIITAYDKRGRYRNNTLCKQRVLRFPVCRRFIAEIAEPLGSRAYRQHGLLP